MPEESKPDLIRIVTINGRTFYVRPSEVSALDWTAGVTDVYIGHVLFCQVTEPIDSVAARLGLTVADSMGGG
jgi:hypothetical protein